MLHQSEHLGSEAGSKAGLSFVFLCISPLLGSLLGVLLALFGPAHGILEWIHKAMDILGETNELRQRFGEGTFFTDLKSGYVVCLYFGLVVFSLLVVVSALCLASRIFGRKLAAAVEGLAAVIWLAPYWICKVGSIGMWIATNLVMLVGYCLAVVQMFKTAGFITAILGSMVSFGILTATATAVNLSFAVTVLPLYLCLQYVVPLGFLWAQRDGIAGRQLENAFVKEHFPFW
jgi:hypothetical protein